MAEFNWFTALIGGMVLAPPSYWHSMVELPVSVALSTVLSPLTKTKSGVGCSSLVCYWVAYSTSMD